MCKCTHFAVQLIEQGFFPTAPSQPNLAVSISFLEFYRVLFKHMGNAVSAVAATLSNFYDRRGNPVVDKKVSSDISCTYIVQGEPIANPFCKLFGAAAQWYECLHGEIHQCVEDAIECAYISATQGAPPQPASPPTTAEEPLITNSAPTWVRPSATHAARLLQRRCPACFGVPMTGQLFKE